MSQQRVPDSQPAGGDRNPAANQTGPRRFLDRVRRRLLREWDGMAFEPPEAAWGVDLDGYFEQVRTCYEPLANPFDYYRRLVAELRQVERLRLAPLYELATSSERDARVVGLRHDVDADPVTALRCARHLAREGICGSFYLLHTAPYYGQLVGGRLIRHARLREWVRGFVVAGCELGLHNDCLTLYRDYGVSGAKALQQELAWLRSEGAVVRGTVAHNCGAVYGAENYEIFAERQLWTRPVRTPSGKRVPLGQLRERDLDLQYEGTFAVPRAMLDRAAAQAFFGDPASADVRSEAWMRRFLLDNPCCEWEVGCQCWLTGRDRWVVAGRRGHERIFEWDVDLTRMLEVLRQMPDGSRAVLVVHPEYVRA